MQIPTAMPAAYLTRAAENYTRLVPTHPMEAAEWQDGLDACRQLAADLVFQGKWPEVTPGPPAIPPVKEPESQGGLTRSEQLVSHDLVQFWNSLPQAGHVTAVASAVHACQSTLQSRILRRLYPDYWMSTPNSLQQDAQAERERWITSKAQG